MIDKNSIIVWLDILLEANIISTTVRGKSEAVIDKFITISNDFDQEKMEVFCVHMAIALSRVEKGECEAGLDENIVAEIKQNAKYVEASKILDEVKDLIQVEIPDGEEILLLIHICNLLER